MLAIEDLTAHRGAVCALDRVHTELPAGAVTALVGANGAGKSTLLDVLAGVLTPSSGRVRLPPGCTVGYVPQTVAVGDQLPLTVGQTVAMGRWRERGPWRRLRAEDRELIASVADRLGLTGLLGRSLAEVSGGQRRRALVAQGLVGQADVLLVDEPTAGVDAETRAVLIAALAEEAARGVVVVHATHEPAAVEAADTVRTLVAGRLVPI